MDEVKRRIDTDKCGRQRIAVDQVPGDHFGQRRNTSGERLWPSGQTTDGIAPVFKQRQKPPADVARGTRQ